MPSKCWVPGCRSNYNKDFKASVFSFPRDEVLKKLWIKSVNRSDNKEPTKASKICEKHFKPEDIITEATGFDSKTNITITVALQIFRLKPEAVPSIFNNLSSKRRRKRTSAITPVDDKCSDLVDDPQDIKSSDGLNVTTTAQEKADERMDEHSNSSNDKSNSSSCSGTLPSPYKNLPTVTVCLKQEDRVIIPKDLRKVVKRSPSTGSNSSNGSTEANKASMLPKRRKVERPAPTVIGRQNDCYCWVCHRENTVLCCIACPRAYHSKCAGELNELCSDWVCPECKRILAAENVDSRSTTLSEISLDKLCALLKLSLNKMKHRAPVAFHQPVSLEHYPLYPHYVIHPMDFSLLEKNIKQKLYGCTEAFLIDVKWILHNSCVFNGTQHPLSTNAKSMVKTCEHDMQEIEVCPDCFMHSVIRNKYWFSEVCRKPHPLVWAKLKGFPYWPAKVVRIQDGNVDARFFGAHDRAWVPVLQCYHLSKEMPTTSKPKKKGNYESALDELNVHVHLLIQKFGSFEYAPYRTNFNPQNKFLMHHGIDIEKIVKEDASFDASPMKIDYNTTNKVDSMFPDSEQEKKSNNDIKLDSSPSDSVDLPSFQATEGALSDHVLPTDELKLTNEKCNQVSNEEKKPASAGIFEISDKNAFENATKSICNDPPNTDTHSMSDSDQLRKLELALERIKGYVSSTNDSGKGDKDVENESDTNEKGIDDDSDDTKAINDKNTDDQALPEKISVGKPTSLDTLNLPMDVPNDCITENIISVLDSSKKNDSFSLKLTETIESCKAKLGISEILEDEVLSDSESVEEEEENASLSEEEGSDTSSSESEDESNSEMSDTDIETVEETDEVNSINLQVKEISDEELSMHSKNESEKEHMEEEMSEHSKDESEKEHMEEDMSEHSKDESEKEHTEVLLDDNDKEEDSLKHKSESLAKSVSEIYNSESDNEAKSVDLAKNKIDNTLEKGDLTQKLSDDSFFNNEIVKASNSSQKPNMSKMPITVRNQTAGQGSTLQQSDFGSVEQENVVKTGLSEQQNVSQTAENNSHDIQNPAENCVTTENCNTKERQTRSKKGSGGGDDDDDDILICNSPPRRAPTPELICLDDGTDAEPETEEKSVATNSSANNESQYSLRERRRKPVIADPDAYNTLNRNVYENPKTTKNTSCDQHVDENRTRKRKLRSYSLDESSEEDIQVVNSVNKIPRSGAKRTFNFLENKKPTTGLASKQAEGTASFVESDVGAGTQEKDLSDNMNNEESSDDNANSEQNSASERNVNSALNSLNPKDIIDNLTLRKKLNYVIAAFQVQQWKQMQEKAELRHNMNLIIMEMRACLEADKKQAIETLSRTLEREKNRCIEETKRKQWCAYCHQESRYACCWNTSYCTLACQKRHFPEHRNFCTQLKGKINTEGSDAKTKNSTDMSENKGKVFVLNMKTTTDPAKSSTEAITSASIQQLPLNKPQIQVVTPKSSLQLVTSPSSSSQVQVLPNQSVQFVLAPVKSPNESASNKQPQLPTRDQNLDSVQIINNVRNRVCNLGTAISLLKRKNQEQSSASSQEKESLKTEEANLEEIYFPSPPKVRFEGYDSDPNKQDEDMEEVEKTSSDTEIEALEDKNDESAAEDEEFTLSESDDVDNEMVYIGHGVDIKAKFLNKCLIYGRTAKRLTRCLVDVIFSDIKLLASCSAFGQKSNVTKLTRAALPARKVAAIIDFVGKRFPASTRSEIVLAINMKCKEARNILGKKDAGNGTVKKHLLRRLLAKEQGSELSTPNDTTTTTTASVTTTVTPVQNTTSVSIASKAGPNVVCIKTSTPSTTPAVTTITLPRKQIIAPNILRCSPQILIRPKPSSPNISPVDRTTTVVSSAKALTKKRETVRNLLSAARPYGDIPKEATKILLKTSTPPNQVASQPNSTPSSRSLIILSPSVSPVRQSTSVTQPHVIPSSTPVAKK